MTDEEKSKLLWEALSATRRALDEQFLVRLASMSTKEEYDCIVKEIFKDDN